jgi:C-terminal processing protease CtpA/Prc
MRTAAALLVAAFLLLPLPPGEGRGEGATGATTPGRGEGAPGTTAGAAAPGADSSSLPPVLAEIDRRIRAEFWSPDFGGADWGAAVAQARREIAKARNADEENAAYDRLLAVLADSHTFRVPSGRLPPSSWGTSGLRIGRSSEGDGGYSVKGLLPGTSAERSGMKTGDRVLAVGGKALGKARSNFRDLFLALEGYPRAAVEVEWAPAGAAPRKTTLLLEPESPGDSLVWKSARVIRRDGKAYGYAHLWGISSQTALAVVDLLSDRVETARVHPELAGLDEAEGFLLDVRGNSGGYDPDILSTFLRGAWTTGDYWLESRGRRRLVPPEFKKLPVVLLVNSGTVSSGEALALKFRRHRIGPIVGETTAGMLSGGAMIVPLPDGSTLWFAARRIFDADGHAYDGEGKGVVPDVAVADRPPATPGQEDAIVEAGIRALQDPKITRSKD